uniref:Uncharacterized protein n=1 Tax=Anguilla anguilla TaxID=7936 RepID=A0A0E9VRE8_ANGAN
MYRSSPQSEADPGVGHCVQMTCCRASSDPLCTRTGSLLSLSLQCTL